MSSKSLIALATLTTTMLAGCPCYTGSPFAEWHFESDCPDALCGFTASNGTAERVDAIAPGEHALRLSAGTSVDRALMQVVPPAQTRQSVSVNLVARCEANSSLHFTVLISETRSSDAAFSMPNLRTVQGTIVPGEQWSAGSLQIVSNAQTSSAVTSSTIVSLQITADSAGACAVDDVSIALETGGYCS